MPIRILIIGLLFCLGGAFAIWDVLSAIPERVVNLNFAVFLLPVGIGLLRGMSRSRLWAQFWIILGYLGCCFLGVVVLASPESAFVSTEGWLDFEVRGAAAVKFVMLGSAIAVLVLAYVNWMLFSDKAKAFFEKNSEQADSPNPAIAPRFQIQSPWCGLGDP